MPICAQARVEVERDEVMDRRPVPGQQALQGRSVPPGNPLQQGAGLGRIRIDFWHGISNYLSPIRGKM